MQTSNDFSALRDVSRPALMKGWRGLGGWNAYFIGKMILLQIGALNFHVFYNLLLAAALLFPLRWNWLHRVRQVLAVPAGIALLYYDTWYPPISRLLARPEVLQFSWDYLLDLLGRFVRWDMVGAGFILWVAYLFLAQWVRLTTFTVVALSWLMVSSLTGITLEGRGPAGGQEVVAAPVVARATEGAVASSSAGAVQAQGQAQAPMQAQAQGRNQGPGQPPTDAQLNQALQAFYAAEATRHVSEPASLAGQPPFDVLFISICSMATDDLTMTGLLSHPLFRKMDVMFDDFNSATSYSGPAVLRLLRANCGQVSHHDLYQPADPRCYLFDQLRALGFHTQLALNHDGQFEDFARTLEDVGHLPRPDLPTALKPSLRAFDGSPIWDDRQVLDGWWKRRQQSGQDRVALLYNTISLHDGNRAQLADGGSRLAPFQDRAQTLLDGIDAFLSELDRSGRKVLVVLIPEHGAGLRGDRMQISGMREIPSPTITRVPVGIRLVGGKAPHGPTIHVQDPSSFLALSELVSRILGAKVFEQPQVDWQRLVTGLPQTQAVSENAGDVLMSWNGTPYVRMDQGAWIPYPR
ncbi:Cellulose biosynthesis protein BcsG [Castellaniella defragrans]